MSKIFRKNIRKTSSFGITDTENAFSNVTDSSNVKNIISTSISGNITNKFSEYTSNMKNSSDSTSNDSNSSDSDNNSNNGETSDNTSNSSDSKSYYSTQTTSDVKTPKKSGNITYSIGGANIYPVQKQHPQYSDTSVLQNSAIKNINTENHFSNDTISTFDIFKIYNSSELVKKKPETLERIPLVQNLSEKKLSNNKPTIIDVNEEKSSINTSNSKYKLIKTPDEKSIPIKNMINSNYNAMLNV